MLKAVIDTNVIISATISDKGNPAKILQMVFDEELAPVFDASILSEYMDVLSRPKFKFSQTLQDSILQGLKWASTELTPPTIKVSTVPFDDESDRKFYDLARSCEVILITGNGKHYPNEPFIMTPSQFLQSL